jgi:hypothetical protein
MARLVSYRANRAGMRDVIKSEGVDAMLGRRAQSVAQVAQSGYDAAPPHSGQVDVDVVQEGSDSDRARVAVIARHPAALAIERDRRILGSAISAARS